MDMNRLIIDDSKIHLDGDIKLKEEVKFLDVKDLNLKIEKDSDLIIECNSNSLKLNITINILKGVNLNLYEFKTGENYKIRYTYYLEKESTLNIEKINDAKNTFEQTIFNLNGENSKVIYNFKTISKTKEKYNFLVYHNASKTFSDIKNNGVNIENGTLEFNVSSFVPKRMVKCNVSQSARIINETSKECIIKPNLFIDEEDVCASHSALIGTFSYDEIFYLMSRGIDESTSKKMLSKGFLLKGISHYRDKFENIIDMYWR